MSSELSIPATVAAVAVPRTAVPLGIVDPVEQARAELKAALAAIEDKTNVSRKIARATDRARVKAKAHPVAATAAVVGAAAAVGAIVWMVVRAYTR